MDLKSHCPRCHAKIGSNRDSCPACQSVLPPTVPPWATSTAYDGGARSPSDVSSLGNAANSKSPAYIPTYPAPDALNKNHQLDLTTQPPPQPIGGHGVRAVRERLYRFIHHSGPPAVDTSRSTRACLSCYNSAKCEPGPNPDCCGPCKGKSRYCRGPIHAPILINIPMWFEMAFASLQSRCGSLEAIVKERSMYSLSIEVNKTRAIETYDIDLQNLDGDMATPYNSSSLARVLDVVFPTNQKVDLNTRSLGSQHNPDNNVESVIRRFVACSMLLCTAPSSRIDRSQCERAVAPYVILEFIRQLGHEACNLFQCIFLEADEFANSKPRNKATFVRDKRSFAFNLGLVHSSVQSLISAKSNWTGSHFMPGDLYDVMPAVLEKLEWLALGFNKKGFIEGLHCLRREAIEVYISLPSLPRRFSIATSSSNQAYSLGDDLVRNLPPMDSPIAQDSAGQSPGQVSNTGHIQHSRKIVAGNLLDSPRLVKEFEPFPQNDLHDISLSPVEGKYFRDDPNEHARTESKKHEAAITKHLVKKAALEEKLNVWQLDSDVSDGIVDSDGCGGNSFQSGLAIEKRIRELKEASKRQDVAIQKHNIKKAALERGIKRHLDSESGQPSKKPVFEADQELDVAVPVVPQNAEKIYQKENCCAGLDQIQSVASPTRQPSLIHLGRYESILEDATPHQGRESADNITLMPIMSLACVNIGSTSSSSTERMGPIKGRGNWGYRVQQPKQQTPFKETIEQRDQQPNLNYASGGPASPGRSFTNWLLRRRPSSFGSVMDGMLKKFERVAIGAWPARKARHTRKVPVDDPVKA